MKKILLTVAATVSLLAVTTAQAGAPTGARLALAGRRLGSHVHAMLSNRVIQRNNKDLLGVVPGIDIPLMYGGGPVERQGSASYAIFWEPAGSVVSGTYHSLIQRYFQDIGGTPFYGLMSQYDDGNNNFIVNSSALSGTYTDTRAYPESPLQDADIQAEVTHVMGLTGWTGGIGRQFFVFTPKGVNSCDNGSCSFSTYCAYHGFFSSGGTDVLYASMPYAGTDLGGCGTPSSPNGDADADAEISIISHEHFETVTDPKLDAWTDLLGEEIGDKCRSEYGTIDAAGANVYLHGHPYIAQMEYSNRALPILGDCALS